MTDSNWCLENPNPTAPFHDRVGRALEIAGQIEALAKSLAVVVASEYPGLASGWRRRLTEITSEVARQYPIDDRRWTHRSKYEAAQQLEGSHRHSEA